MQKWRFWVDRGGTFTDIVGAAPDGQLVVEKRPSSEPGGGLAAARKMLGISPKARIPAKRVAEIRIGTTIATNALLERRGDKTAIAVTRGFADALIIGDQTRPNLFGIDNVRSAPLWSRAVEIEERIGANGEIVLALNEEDTRNKMRQLAKDGFRSVAVALMHGFSFPRHERRVCQIARQAGMPLAVASHLAAPFVKFVPRARTAAVDAYLDAALKEFVGEMRRQCESGVRLLFMQSDGTLASEKEFHAAGAVLSGPAGGAVGSQKSASSSGRLIIGFDMGGTSTDVSLGAAELRMENRIAGAPFFSPMLDIHTVAAGGGSVARAQDGRLLTGPQSAGAFPGPACYGNGGPLTVTDCNVMLGKLRAEFFPKIFGKTKNQPLDESIVAKKFAALSKSQNAAPVALAEGFVRVAVEHMAAAARRISVARGIDPAVCIINSFGGAAGQHICMVANAIGAKNAFVSRYAPVLSAWGIGAAESGATRRQTAECELDSSQLSSILQKLEKDAIKGTADKSAVIRRRIFCRYAGVDSSIPILHDKDPNVMRRDFERQHRRLFGYCDRKRKVMAAVVEVSASVCPPDAPKLKNPNRGKPEPMAVHRVVFAGRRRKTPFYDWSKLANNTRIDGPAVIVDKWNTAVIDPEWQAKADAESLRLRRVSNTRTNSQTSAAMLEVFCHRFMAAAEQMGETLRRSAVSVNIRERLDFSCAVFDSRGRLVANAPHIPVHLGSMGDSVRYLLRKNPPGLARGDAFMLNSPYHGGTHLPDITLMKAGRLDGKAGAPDFFVAARGHHADIGGISAGSMPADSSHIEEEGALIKLCPAVLRGRLREKEILSALCKTKYPARTPQQNLADLLAQSAALEAGVAELRRAVADFGGKQVLVHMRKVQDAAALACRRLILQLQNGSAKCQLDDGATIQVQARIDREARRAVFDFTGSSPTHPANFNAPKSVAYAAVIYCLRVLLGADMPLNDGIMRPVKLIIPKHSMLDPRPPAAVAAGNVEVSQNIADAVFAALGVCAHAQGTCNNFTLGFGSGGQYYETICGGLGASADADGGDAMQAHMTNSRASDPEILENAHPLRLEHFGFRKNSGGKGKHKGGDGAVRRIRFLAEGEATILSSRRKVAPRGMRGGKDGMPGRNAVQRAAGKLQTLPACAHIKMKPGDTFMIETPGGGGWGRKQTRSDKAS